VKQFITAAERATDTEENTLEFEVGILGEDGKIAEIQKCKAFKPEPGQIAMLMATTQARHLSQGEQVAGMINFFVEVLDEESHTLIVSRLLNRKDPFGIQDVQDIIWWMMGEWSGHPTEGPSGSTPSQTPAGPTSTPPTPTSTSSVFQSTDSSTSSTPGVPVV
jgi:hypothetical protein